MRLLTVSDLLSVMKLRTRLLLLLLVVVGATWALLMLVVMEFHRLRVDDLAAAKDGAAS